MGEKLTLFGVVELPITIDTNLFQKIMMLDFVVVDKDSPYQIILGKPFLESVGL